MRQRPPRLVVRLLRSALAVVALLTVTLLAPAAHVPSAVAAPGEWSATSSLADARASHTATRLFGGKVLLAGGSGSAGSLASAELFDPQTGNITRTGSLADARSSHTATLISGAPFQCRANCGKVLVSGGTGSGGSPLATAELFDPASGTWTRTGSLTTARTSHTATLLPNGRILVSGGTTTDGNPVATAEVFNPADGTWSATGALVQARSAHTATPLRDGKVLVAGGVDVDGRPVSSAETYDPATGTWTATGSLADARSSHTATPLGDEISGRSDPRVLVTGGTAADGRPLASTELYNPATGNWSKSGSLAEPRTSHAATLLADGKVFVTGGSGADGDPLRSAELYDREAGTWANTGPMAAARSSHTLTPLLDGRVLATGGNGRAGKLASAELYEPSLGPRWLPTDSLRQARSAHTATRLDDGRALVVGGHTSFDFFRASGPNCCNLAPLASTETYDPQAGRWTSVGSLQQARSFHTATLLPNGKVLVTGGFTAVDPPTPSGNAQTVASAELFDPATGTWSSTAPMLQARAWHTATLLGNGKVLVVGGTATPEAGTAVDSAELYDPVSQTWTATGSLTGAGNQPNRTGPRGAREVHTATLLERNCGDNCGKVLVVGGTGGIGSGPAYSTAELYNPATGSFRATESMSQLRQVHAATELSDGRVLVTGGFNSPFTDRPPHLDTAEVFNPATEEWQAVGSLGHRRMYHTATLLPDGNVLAAGGNAGGNAPSFPNKPGPGLFSAELFDPSSSTWSPTNFLNTGRALHTATLLTGSTAQCGDNCGKVLAVGGDREVIGNFSPYLRYMSPLDSAELYPSPQPPAVSPPATEPPLAPSPTPTPPAPPLGACGIPGGVGYFNPAKLRVARARVLREDRRLDVLAPITSRADGDVAVTFHADNRKDTFDEDVSEANTVLDVIRISKRITRGQARLGTGIVNINYLGDEDTRPEFVRLRAASQRAELDVEEISLIGDRLSATGSVTGRANGVVRFRYSYVDPDGTPNVHEARAKIKNNGDWKLNKDQVPAQLAQCGGYLSIQFTGYFPRRIRGEQLAYELNAGQTRRP